MHCALQGVGRVQPGQAGFVKVLADHGRLEDGCVPHQKHRGLTQWRDFEEPVWLVGQVDVSTDGFTEDGGAAALSVDDATYNVTFANIGLRAATSFDVGGTVVRLKGQASWRHAFSDNAPDASMALAGGSVFDIQGASASRDTAVVKAGIDFDVAKNSSVSVNYVGEFAAGGADHGVNAGFKLKF